MFPGIKIEQIKKEKQELDHQLLSIITDIRDYFGDDLKCNSMTQLFTNSCLLQIGTSLLKEYGHCEYCKNYLGPNPIHRKMYDIFVINGYCREVTKTVKPNDRCSFIDLNSFWLQIVKKKVGKVYKGYDYLEERWPWIKPGYIDEYDPEFPELTDY